MGSQALCELRGASRYYKVRKGFFSSEVRILKALDKVDLELKKGEILGLVGESGCGKSTLARLVLGLERPTKGEVLFEGRPIPFGNNEQIRAFRRRVQMVFQDPFSSLNPKKTIFQTISQPLKIHKLVGKDEIRREVRKLLKISGLDTPGIEDRYPHEFSGGQRQRICIARALATRPDVIVADEPTSALDVSVQAQIINLLLDLHESKGISCLFISHDLPLVGFISHRIAVMYKGNLLEIMPKRAFDLGNTDPPKRTYPHHPYTEYLLDSVPIPDPHLYQEQGPPSWLRPKTPETEWQKGLENGCVFASRCPLIQQKCVDSRPAFTELDKNHFIACHRIEALMGKGVDKEDEIR